MKLHYCKSHKSLLNKEQLGSVLRNVFFICLFFSYYSSLSAQSDKANGNDFSTDPSSVECSMNVPPAELQKIIARDAKRLKDGKGTAKSMVRDVPVKIHIIRDSNGSGGLALSSALADIAQANTIYSAAEFNFYQCGTVNYIDNDDFHTNLTKGYALGTEEYDMAIPNRIPDALNVFYCTNTSSGSSWSSFPYYVTQYDGKDWIVMKNSQSDNGSTFSHEAGHYLDLYHTHQGSENVTRVSTSSCYNCETSGDLLCDTHADNGGGFTAPPACGYSGSATNSCDGLPYTPLTDNVMSYAQKPCRIVFTAGQINRMKLAYDNDRTNIHNPTSCPIECTTDASEPNNSSSAADYLGTASNYTLNDLCLTSGDNDYFRVYVWGKSYYIRVKGNGTATGEYKLTYSRSGATMTIETAPNNGSSTDTYMFLYVAKGSSLTALAINNNGGTGLFSKITYTIPPCNAPTTAQNYTGNISHYSARLYCTTSGTYRDFRYKVNGASSWTNVSHTSASNKYINGLSASTTYVWQSRVYCGPWSSWSSNEYFTTNCAPEVATASEIDNSQSIYCNYAYAYCQGHTGDQKQFQLKNLATNAFSYTYSTSHYSYLGNLTSNTNYRYRVRMKCGTTGYYGGWSPYEYFTTTTCLAGDTGNSLTGEFPNTKIASSSIANSLDIRNYPNPFNGQTTIEFDLVNDADVTLFVSDITGRKIAVLLNNEPQSRGINQVTFDGSNQPAGIYYYTMQAGEHLITKKMILVK